MSEMRRGRFVSVHGIDGTGKTSTAQAVVEALAAMEIPAINYDSYRQKGANPHSIKKEMADRAGTLEERVAAYLESMMYHATNIDALLEQGFHVVKSRYLDDICAHFSHLGASEEVLDALRKKFPMVQPDLKVILQLSDTERRKRIDARGVLDDRDLDKKEPGTRLHYFEDYLFKAAQKAPAGSVLHIDTGTCDIQEVSRRIIGHILADVKQ